MPDEIEGFEACSEKKEKKKLHLRGSSWPQSALLQQNAFCLIAGRRFISHDVPHSAIVDNNAKKAQ